MYHFVLSFLPVPMLQLLNSSHVEQVCAMLTRYFENHNRLKGESYLQTDIDLMKKNVSGRLSKNAQSAVKYFGIVEDGRVKGFVNYFDNQNKGVLEILLLVDEGLSAEEKKLLVDHCIYEKQKK